MSVLPAWAPFAAMIFAIFVAVVIIWMTIQTIQHFRRSHVALAIDNIIVLVAYCYGLGVSLKLASIGPEFARYYLADIGFPVMLVLFMSVLSSYVRRYDDKSTEDLRIRSARLHDVARLWLVPVAFTVSLGYELFSGLVHARADGPVPYIGNFDWLDVVMYAIGSLVLAGLLLWKLSLYKLYFRVVERYEQDQAERRRAKQANGSSPSPQPRKRYKKKIKRGVR